MTRAFPWVFVVGCALFPASLAHAEDEALAVPPALFQTGLSQDRVKVGLRYQGDQLFLYGTVPPETTDLVAVLQSRHSPPLKLTRTARVAGLWFGVKEFEVSNLPQLYLVNFSCPLCNGMHPCPHRAHVPELQRILEPYGGVGYASLQRHAIVKRLRGAPADDDLQVLFSGLLRIKQEAGLYALRPNAFHREASGMFCHSFSLPDGAPEDRYDVTTYALKDGELLGRKKDSVLVKQVGPAASLSRLAHSHAWWYGLLTIVVAIATGALAGSVCRRSPSR